VTKLFHKIQYDKRRGDYVVFIRRDGKRKYFNLGTTRKEAVARLERLETDIAAGRITFTEQTTQIIAPDGSKDMCIKELADKHLEWMRTNRAIGTFRNRRSFVLQFLDFLGRDMQVSEITRAKLEEFYAWAKTRIGNRRSKSKNCGNEALASIKAFLKWGEEMEMVDLPFKRFPKISFTPPELHRISDVDLQLLLSHADPDFRDLLLFGILSGLRPSELRGLTVSQIGHSPDGSSFIFIQTHKTSKTARTYTPRSVPLSAEGENIIERQMMAHPKAATIFVDANGNPYGNWTLRNKFRRLCKKAGVRDTITAYDLRHEFASRNSDNGVETTGLAQLMGHSTTRTLMRYVKNTHAAHKRAIDAVEKGLQSVLHPVPENSVN